MRSPLTALRNRARRMRRTREEAIALADDAAIAAALHARPGASMAYLLHTTRVPLPRLNIALHRLTNDGTVTCVTVPEDHTLGRREWTLNRRQAHRG